MGWNILVFQNLTLIAEKSLLVNSMFNLLSSKLVNDRHIIGILGGYLLVTSERILPAESLFIIADLAPHLLPRGVVNCILMASKIIRAGKNGVTRLSCSWVDSSALVWA